MAELRLSQASRDALQAHCATPEGSTSLDELARLIAQTVVKAMPPDLLATLETEEGTAAFRKAWPHIVDAFLFPGAREKAVLAGTRLAINKGGRRRRPSPAK